MEILLVDDSAVQRKVLRGNFEKWGHTVVAEAANGDDALELYDRFHPALITLDISMRGMDGLECLRLLHEKDPQLKAIMITALATKDRVSQAMEYGCIGFVVKPIDWNMLRNLVDGAA